MTFFGLKEGIWRTGRHTPTKNSQEYPPPGCSLRRTLEKEKLGLGIPHRPTLNGRTVVELDKRVNCNFRVSFFFFFFFLPS